MLRVRWCALVLAIGLLAGGARADADKAADAVLARAVAYVEQFEQTFSAVTWREQYEQEDRLQQRFNSSGSRAMRVAGKRSLQAQMLLVWLPRDATFITVRDVIAIDGRPRPESERPLDQLASSGSSISVTQLQAVAAENGRFNIGEIRRTFSEPTLTLTFLDSHYRYRFKFERRGDTELTFVEKERPTVIRSGDRRDVPARGSIWIDPDTGRITQTFMTLKEVNGLTGSMTVRYGPYAGFDVLVPLQMDETYTSERGEEVVTRALYSDFKHFETSGRIIVPQ